MVSETPVQVQRLDPDLPLPSTAHVGDAGIDLYARHDALIEPGGGRSLVPTGIAIALPVGFGGFVIPRSGLAARHGVTVLNGPGLIDAGYRGEVMVPLVNTDPTAPFEVLRGDRIAQLVVMAVPRVAWMPVEELPPTLADDHGVGRGSGGHGSSGR